MKTAGPFLASAPRRIAAGAFDTFIVILCAIFTVACLKELGAHTAALVASMFVVFAAYHAIFQHYWSGETIGCRALSIRVVGSGRSIDLTLLQCLARPSLQIAWLFAFLPLAIYFKTRWLAAVPVVVDLALLFYFPSRQTVSDLLCRTLVVNVPPPQPHRAPAAPMFSAKDAEFGAVRRSAFRVR